MENMSGTVKTSIALAAAFVGGAALAALEPVAPKDGASVSLLTPAQKSIMAFGSYDERLAALRADKKKPAAESVYFGDDAARWRVAAPLTLEWRATDGENEPWKIVVSTNASLSGAARVLYLDNGSVRVEKTGDGASICRCTVPRANLEVGRTYYWKVWSDVKCDGGYAHGSMLCGACKKCGRASKVHESPVASFVTERRAPRWIALEGNVANVRDIGGWTTLDGRRVRQGMAFRGQGLNDNSMSGDAPGRNRLTMEDAAYLVGVLGIRTDLDLRTRCETAGMERSPLGGGVRYISRPSPLYDGIFRDGDGADRFEAHGKRTMAENFRVFCDPANYPIYFHCIGGADRTGAVAYVLHGVLGVSRHDLETDWENTFYPDLPEMREGAKPGVRGWRSKFHLDDGFAKYGGADTPWNERIVLYLKDCGITDAEIERFRSIMLEPAE